MNSTVVSPNWSRSARLEYLRLLEERNRRQTERLRATIAEARARHTITPDAVYAFAALHLRTDSGRPVEPAAHHELWVKLLCDWRIKRLLIIAPPESAKTTWTISAYLGCKVGIFPESNTIIGSVSGPVAERRALSLRGMVETPEWQATFPGILPVAAHDGMKWGTTEWSLAPNGQPASGRLHPTISAYGTGGSVIGSRADEIIADDLLDEDNSRTAHQRGLVERWLHTSLLSRRKARVGRIVVVGTAWHEADIYANIRRSPDWVVCHVPLLTEGDRVWADVSYPDDWSGPMLGEPVTEDMKERD